MRLATWNIRAGGGKRIPAIADVILREEPDVLVLTEYRPKPGQALLERLSPLNYHMVAGEPDGPHNSVCVLSKSPVRVYDCPRFPKSLHRWVSVATEFDGVVVLGVHVPNVSEVWNKREFLECIDAFVKANLDGHAVVIGDLNTARDEDCEGAFINEATYFNGYLECGWVDAWRRLHPDGREFTWYSHKKNGFRLDHCLISPSLVSCLGSARYRHDVRTDGLSDHSSLHVEFAFEGVA
ncbi:MAG: endonuclease/exonuclease/phosphatase family protein [Armatimonadetes bacterium]|nr:endonuclease/exonuclease/phosphatase family protein [Armatimonadota bacterium]